MANKKQSPKSTSTPRAKPKPKSKGISEETPTEKPKGKPRGKPKIDISQWEQDNNLILLSGWAKQGLSMQEIAHNIGISRRTLYNWQDQSEPIRKALEQSRELADIVVENALFTSAITGNVLAQIFWLKNRRPQYWRDKVEKQIEVNTEEMQGGICFLPHRLPPNNPPTESEDKSQ
jgi:DNA-binding XRE family transcriptional regulator